jgi:hypothetical protein
VLSCLSVDARSVGSARDVLDAALEETLLTGRGPFGETHRLRTLEDWRDAWARWRDVVLPKAARCLPGRRPFACYVVGEIPRRELLAPPPLDNPWFRVYVASADGTGTWHYDYPEPYQRAEHWHLADLGAIELDEVRQYRPLSRRELLRVYPWEAGSLCGGASFAATEPQGESIE